MLVTAPCLVALLSPLFYQVAFLLCITHWSVFVNINDQQMAAMMRFDFSGSLPIIAYSHV
jgi:hypothetical protein